MTLPRMLVVDLDGTALTGRDQLRDDDREAALALKAMGIPVTIATGRLLAGTRWVAEAMEVEGAVAVMNGSSRFDVGRHQVVHADAFAPDEQLRAASVFDELGLPGFLFGLDAIHVHEAHHDAYLDYLSIWTPQVHVHDGGAWSGVADTLAIGAVGADHAIQAARERLVAAHPGLRAKTFQTFAGEAFLELRVGVQDKGTAVEALAAERGIALEDVVAVGDWWNDLPMLRRVGHAYAMGDAAPEVLATAHHTLDSRARHGGAIAELARRIWDLR